MSQKLDAQAFKDEEFFLTLASDHGLGSNKTLSVGIILATDGEESVHEFIVNVGSTQEVRWIEFENAVNYYNSLP
jgi:hypothetical protein